MFGWTEEYMMGKTPRWLKAYLDAHARVVARNRPDDVMTAGFLDLPADAKKRQLNLWATIARGDAATPAALGERVVKEADGAAWLRAHGKLRLPSNG